MFPQYEVRPPTTGRSKVTLLLGHLILMGAQWALSEVRLGQEDWKINNNHGMCHDLILGRLIINSLLVMSQYKWCVGCLGCVLSLIV